MLGTAAVGIAAAAGLVGYALYYWLDSVPSIKEVIDGIRGIVEYPSNKVMEAVESATDKILLQKTHAEIYAARAESDAEFEAAIAALTQRANTLLKSDFPMQRTMGQKILDSIPVMRQKHRDRWADILTRWNRVHLDNNPGHLG